MALYFESGSISLDGKAALSKDSLLALSEDAATRSILIYERWIDDYSADEEAELRRIVERDFLTGLDEFPAKEKQRFLSKRVKDIKEAQLETPRRLSVAYTNLGIIKRHQEKYTEAIEYYKNAIGLWDRNLTAENNLNKLLGRPVKKQNILQKIFPPEKEK